jgi:hypothetical protein
MVKVRRIQTDKMSVETLFWDSSRDCYVLKRGEINGFEVPETRFYPEEGRGVVNGFGSVDMSSVLEPYNWNRLSSEGEKYSIMRNRLKKIRQESVSLESAL